MRSNMAYTMLNDIRCRDLCLCTEDQGCYRPYNMTNYRLLLVPYCSNNQCKMYGIVLTWPLYLTSSFIDESNNTYTPNYPDSTGRYFSENWLIRDDPTHELSIRYGGVTNSPLSVLD
uniref:Uncharacterized protein n=1 Tax=Acrobeloides nanus TaxID=290746 RepID=A0A914D516_9BILA